MKYREFEKSIGEKLYKEEAEVDIAALIESIHKDKGGRKLLPIFWLSLATLGLVAVLFTSLNSSNNKNSGNSASNLNASSIKSSLLSSDINNATAIPAATPSSLSNKIENNSNNFSNNNFSTSKLNSTNINSELNNPNIKNKSTKAIGNKYSNEINKNHSSVLTSQIKEATTIDAIEQSEIKTNSSFDLPQNSSSEEATNSMPSDQRKEEERDFTSTLSQLYRLPSFINFAENKLFIPKDKIVECPRFSSKRKLVFSLIPEIGYYQPMKTLTSKLPESPALLNLRKENEKSIDGIQAALYVQAKHTKFPVYVRAGLQVTNQTERMTLKFSTIKRDTTQGVVSIITSQTGDTITYIYGNIIKETSNPKTIINHYSLKSIDLPISIGATKFIGNFNVGAELGATLNLSLSSEGRIVESINSFTSIKSTNNPFVDKVGIGYFGSLFIKREIFTDNSIYLSLRGRMLPKSFSIESSDYTQKYNSFGLHLGYKVDF